MAVEKQEVTVANPAPLGLLGFGMTTLLLNLHNAGLFALSSVTIPRRTGAMDCCGAA